MNNVCLVFGEKKLFVNKDLLSVYSPYFEKMFTGDFIEKKKDSVELHDTNYDDFKQLLRQIYPMRKPIQKKDVDGLLNVADRYQFDHVMDQVEQYMINTDEFTKMEKLLKTNKYNLEKLKNYVLDSLTLAEIKALKGDVVLTQFSKELVALIFERYMILV